MTRDHTVSKWQSGGRMIVSLQRPHGLRPDPTAPPVILGIVVPLPRTLGFLGYRSGSALSLRGILAPVLGCTGENNSLSISTLLQKELTHEFRELRATVERMGLMKANPVFFLLYLLHILLLDVAAWLTLWFFGTSWVPFLLCSVLLSIVQVRALSHPASVG